MTRSTTTDKPPLLSAIFIIDEMDNLEKLPWRESVHSTLKFVDEMIVVHGGKKDVHGRQFAWDYLQSLGDPRIQLLRFDWPDDFDWRQIGRTCAFGHLHAQGRWVMRVLADEVFADDFIHVRDELTAAPADLRMIIVDRLYLLGYAFAHPNHIQLIFRNDKTMGFGTINPAQGAPAMPALFDGPLETDLWFDGQQVVSIREHSILRDPRGIERLRAGETPRAYRPPEVKNARYLPLGLFNVDVNYCTDEEVIRQKERSHGGYDRLPKEYYFRTFPSGPAILDTLSAKLRSMAGQGRLRRVNLPIELMNFHHCHCNVNNPTSRLCRDLAIPWDPDQPPPSAVQRWWRLRAVRWCQTRKGDKC